ncbi:MAG: Ig-like domain-containing protein, partial [Ignavibacteriales bacterium]
MSKHFNVRILIAVMFVIMIFTLSTGLVFAATGDTPTMTILQDNTSGGWIYWSTKALDVKFHDEDGIQKIFVYWTPEGGSQVDESKTMNYEKDYTCSFYPPDAYNKAYTVSLNVSDGTRLASSKITRTMKVVNAPPTIKASVSEGSTIASDDSITLNGELYDYGASGVQKMEAYWVVNGTSYSTKSSSGASLTIAPPANVAGNATLKVKAYTYLSSVVGSDDFSYTIKYNDTTPPEIYPDDPGDKKQGDEVQVTASDRGSGLLSASYSWDSQSYNKTATNPGNFRIPTSGLSLGSHTIYIKVVDKANNPATTNVTYNIISNDTTPPTVTSTIPANNSTVDKGTTISVTFSETVQKGSGAITVNGSSASFSVSGTKATVTTTLNAGASYTVNIGAGAVKDSAGNQSTASSFSFNTSAAADNTPPTLSSIVPTNNQTGVALDSEIVLTFSEAIKKGSGKITLNGASVESNFSVTSNGNAISCKPSLTASTTYTLIFASGAITDSAGNAYAGGTFTFKTLESGTPPAITIVSTTPANGAANVDYTVNPSILSSIVSGTLLDISNFNDKFAVIIKYSQTVVLSNDITKKATVATGIGNIIEGIYLYNVNKEYGIIGIPKASMKAGMTYSVVLDEGAYINSAGAFAPKCSMEFTTQGNAADTTPPVITATPSSGQVASGGSITIEASDASGISDFKYGWAGASNWSTASGTKAVVTAPIVSANTTQKLYVYAIDNSSNKNSSDQNKYYTFEITAAGGGNDTTPPVVTATPSSGQVASGGSITIEASDASGISDFKYGWAGAASWSTASGTKAVVAAPTVNANTTQKLYVYAIDNSSNKNSSDKSKYYTFEITAGAVNDTTPPVITATPSSGQVASGGSITIEATDVSGIWALKYGWAGASSWSTASGTKAVVTAPIVTANTTQKLYVYAIDNSSNKNSSDQNKYYTFEITAGASTDTTVPKISLSPSSGQIASGSRISIETLDSSGI